MRGLFVTGTGTGVGKTVVAAAVCAALRARGEPVAAWKPVVTGTDEPPADGWPPDHDLLAAAAGGEPHAVAPLRFGPPVSPHLAARLAGAAIEPPALLRDARAAGDGRVLVAEGVGGILVPLTSGYLVRDLARDLGLPVVVAATPGLGTINHTLLTLEALRAVGLEVAAVVLTPWPAEPSALERSNRETIARIGYVTVTGLRPTSPDPADLASAGADLPLDDWI
jgi:dethiobiotin synthetase